ncbi:MAG: hypothetical protein JRI55_19445 [Deltaproteobacteria bacterium]|jgi:hypothetical protein|nr:hypothetical protein [Deltaproteobacteria bacterium]
MRATRLFATGAVVLAAVTPAREAAADNMDPALERLVIGEGCRTGRASTGQGQVYDPSSGFVRCTTNDAAFAKLIAQYGAALAPTAMHSARTVGFGGFRLALEGSYTTIDSDAHYWVQGTQGAVDESDNMASVENRSPDDVLQFYSLKFTKGFPFGLEIAGVFGWLANSNIGSAGADIRMALFEGFRAGIPGYFPDLAAGGGVRTVTGTSQFKLTVASVDAQLSKPIPIAGTLIIQPHVGYQWYHTWGDSGTIDLTPNTDALQQCGYAGPNTPATPDPDKPAWDGQPNCTGSSADFNNTVVFDKIRLHRHRIHFGTQLRFQMVHFGVHALTDLVSPADANTETVEVRDPNDPTGQSTITLNNFEDDPRTEGDDTVGKQWTVAFEIGGQF